MRGITKSFPGVLALRDVNLQVRAGEIHAIVGENGAGKSTLMKVLSGVYPASTYSGQIHFDGEARHFNSIRDCERLGIIIIHQELALVPMLSIAENVFLGNEPARGGVIDRFTMYARTRELLARVGLADSPAVAVGTLGVAKQQSIEIAKALSRRVRLLILDEPTASLNEGESARLLQLLLELKSQGIACILISHKLNEITQVADTITVIRDGATVETIDCSAGAVGEDRIVRGMVGRDLTHRYPQRHPRIGEVVFEVRDWRVHHQHLAGREVSKGLNLSVRRGEIVGIAGLMGSGRTEFALSLFGRSYGREITGQVLLDGAEIDVSTVRKAIANGLAYVTEDRKGSGLVLDDDILHNISLANLAAVSRAAVIDNAREHAVATSYRQKLDIRCTGVRQRVGHLSGGNQQKVVLGKWLFTKPRLLILDEPTRGIDVGAKLEIYTLIDQLAADGECILLISSELPELLGMCDRIYVMNEGSFVAELPASEATQEKIMHSIVSAR
jgi:putative multiple sugar transport system ATP-binding protein